MKLHHKTLKKIIKEELYKVLRESQFLPGEEKEELEAIKSLMDKFGLTRDEAIDSIEKTGQELMKDPGYARQYKELESDYHENEELLEFFKEKTYKGKRFLKLKYGENPPEEELQKIKQNAIEFITKENKTDLEEKLFAAYHEEILSRYDSNEELTNLSPELVKLYKDAEKGVLFRDMKTPFKIKELNKKVSEIKKQIDDEVFEKLIYAVLYAQNEEEFFRLRDEKYRLERERREQEQEWEQRILQAKIDNILEQARASQEKFKNADDNTKIQIKSNFLKQLLMDVRGETSWENYREKRKKGNYAAPTNYYEWSDSNFVDYDELEVEYSRLIKKALGDTSDLEWDMRTERQKAKDEYWRQRELYKAKRRRERGF